MMNVLFLDSIDTEVYGGMEEWIRLVAAGLASRGHGVTVAGRRGSHFLDRVRRDGAKVDVLELDISGDFRPQTIANIKRQVTEQHIDLISVNFNKDVRLGGLAARLEGSARVVWSVGLNITSDGLVHKWLTPRLVDGVLVPSISLKRQIAATGYIKEEIIEVIPVGIPDIRMNASHGDAHATLCDQYDLPADCVIAVTVGRFVEQKGHKYLVEAAADLAGTHPNLRWLLLGDGPLEGELRRQMEVRKISDRFAMAGMVEDVTEVLAGCDLMAHPSVEEPFGIAVLEGMRAGLPLVASKVGGIPEVVGEVGGAVLVAPRDSRAFAEAVAGLVDDPERRLAMGRAGRNRYENEFQVERMYDRVEAYFLALVKARGHGAA